MKSIYLLFFLLLTKSAFCGFLPESAFSKDARGVSGASFLKDISSPRFYALGQSGSTILSGESVFYNPGGLYTDGKSSFYASYNSLLEGSYKSQISYSKNFDSAIWGFSWIRGSYGSFEKLNSRGENLGSFSPSDNAFMFSFSKSDIAIHWGSSLKLIRTDLVYESAWTFAIDLGLVSMPSLSKNTQYSLYFRNLGPGMKIGGQTDPLPFEAGGGLKTRWNFADVYIDCKFPSYDSPYITGGAELPLPISESVGLFLRSGLNLRNKSELGWAGVFSGGLGFYSSSINFDYAYIPYGDLGDTHRISVSWLFRGNKKRTINSQILAKIKRDNFIKSRKFVIVPFTNKADSQFPNLGYTFASELSLNFIKSGYNIAQADSSLGYLQAEGKESFEALNFCSSFSADYCIYGEIKPFKKNINYEIKVYNMQEKREEKSFLLESPSSYDFKKAAYKAFSYIIKD